MKLSKILAATALIAVTTGAFAQAADVGADTQANTPVASAKAGKKAHKHHKHHAHKRHKHHAAKMAK
ncbi:hypothetical protein [Limnobacter litoralis]|uniref:Uncharacterized protein n=1 Tax=Limnobacter litoralis TaxID=481366 RepID=A0ABQ5YRJ8_9BURK|nr:hypothetical protein [Limnobacter litoralis]GLR27258.1 hypothetical protein GCM10007875_23490 [Limnobacter litoralis]